MTLQHKPDFNRVKNAWNHFWEGDILDRPPVIATVTKPGYLDGTLKAGGYYRAVSGMYDEQLDLFEQQLESTLFLGESIPYIAPDHGPDQIAACLGSRLQFNPESRDTTVWAEAIVEDWADFLPIELSEENETWRSLLEFSRLLSQRAEGKYLVGCIDFHTHFDALAALRHNDRLCMDFYDNPDLVEKAESQVSALFPRFFNELYKAGNMGGAEGCIGAHPFWSPGTFTTIQCDFIALIGPDIFRRFIMPAIEAEAAFLDHCSFHLDGPGALTHLDDILSIPDIDIIQWVPGAGQKPDHEWIDLISAIQAAGKAAWIRELDLDRIKELHPQLKPNKVAYSLNVDTEEEVNDVITWLSNNT